VFVVFIPRNLAGDTTKIILKKMIWNITEKGKRYTLAGLVTVHISIGLASIQSIKVFGDI
jgi:hypothetical protein